MSKVRDTYRVHDNIESARQFEMKETGRTHWSREEPQKVDLQPIIVKVILLIIVFLLPVLGTLITFKFIYRAFVVGVLLLLSVEVNAKPDKQHAKISGISMLLVGGGLYGAYLSKHRFAPCTKRGVFRLKNYYSLKEFNPIRK